MAERQQKLLANRIAGTPELSEQAIDDGKRTEAVARAQLDQQCRQRNVLDSRRMPAPACIISAALAPDRQLTS